MNRIRNIACCLIFLLTPLGAYADNHAQAQDGHSATLVYELRTYTSHAGKLGALEDRFRNHTMALFEKHGIMNVSYWKPLNLPDTLIYLVAHKSELDAATAWQAFGSDPQWQAVYAESIAEGRLVQNIERVFMTTTDYSPQRHQ
jgi:hypothetical protein